MEIERTDRFKKDYVQLPSKIKDLVDKKIKILVKNPKHPSLRIHKIKKKKGWFELSVTRNYRIIFEIETNLYRLLAVGSHKVINRI